MMKFITYYRLRYNPFSKESVTTQNAYRSKDFKEMDFRLNTLAETRGIGAVKKAVQSTSTCYSKSL